MKFIYPVVGAVFCFVLALVFSTGMESQTMLLAVGALLVGAVLLFVGLSAVLKESAEKEAARKSALEQSISTLLDAIQTLHDLKEPAAELKLMMEKQEQSEAERHHALFTLFEQFDRRLSDLIELNENIREVNKSGLEAIRTLLSLRESLAELKHTLDQQEQSEIQRHNALLAQLDQSDRNYREFLELVTQIKEQSKRNSEAIFGELCDLRTDAANNDSQKIEILNQLESYTDEMKRAVCKIEKQQEKTNRELLEALENIDDTVENTIPDLKNSIETQNEANRKLISQIMENYSQLSNQDIALLNKILEESNG